MKIIVLSHFNPYFRPYIFLTVPESLDREDLKQIPSLMELYEKGFFKHLFSTFKTANLLFEIPSEYSIKKKEKFMISIVIENKDNLNTGMTQELLESFVDQCKNIPDLYKALYINSKVYEGDTQKKKEIKLLLDVFYDTFPEENVIFEQKQAKILIFGLSMAGKTTIIRCRRKSISKSIFPTISVDISRILVNNVSMLTYDIPGQSKFKGLWKPYLKGQDGLIFVVDVSDIIKFPDARALLHGIANKPELKDCPLVILFNKIDLTEPNLDKLVEVMGLTELGDRPYKYFTTSGLNNLNIDEAFNWLSLKISERIEGSIPKSDLGIIYCMWDENLGVKNVVIYPKEAFEDPEIVAIRSFSISQFIFGGEEFKRTSVILPFPHLNANAAIYFDFISDEKIRGGILPLALIFYYSTRIPKVILDQFNMFITENFTLIKEKHLDKKNALEVIKHIHSSIIRKIETFGPTVHALKISEYRYEELFKAARDVILIIDRQSGIIIDANKQAENLFQLPFEDLLGLHSSQLLTDKMSEDFREKIFEQIDKLIPLSLNVLNTSGFAVPVEISVNEVKFGNQIVVQCIIRDISERRKTEIELIDSETKYKYLFDGSPLSILLINPKGYVVDINSALIESLGYSREDLLGKRFVDSGIIEQNYIVELLKRFRKEERTNKHPAMDLQLYKKNGEKIWVSIQSSFVKIGSEPYYQIIGRDISSQKEIEKQLKNILKLESITAGIASRFLLIENFDNVINESLNDVGKLFNARKAFLYFFENNYNFIEDHYVWYGMVSFPQNEFPKKLNSSDFPWLCEQILHEDNLFISNYLDLPDEAKAIKDFMKTQKLKNLLISPIIIKGTLGGFISFETISKKMNEEKFILLSIFTKILENAILRESTKEALTISEQEIHQNFDREYFYRELFYSDMSKIMINIKNILESYKDQDKQGLLEISKETFDNIKNEAADGAQLIKILKNLKLMDEVPISIKKVELLVEIKRVIENLNEIYSYKNISIELASFEERLFVYADDFLEDLIENMLISSIRYNESPKIHIKVIVYRNQQEDTEYIKLEFVDHKSMLYDIKKELILDRSKEKTSKIKEVLLGFLLVQRILENYNGKIWVEGENFVILLREA